MDCSRWLVVFVLAAGGVAAAQDAAVLQRIRDEGMGHSQAMQNAAELIDGIGPRLTGSPNMAKADAWAVAKMKADGLVNVRLEDWGPFGHGWVQREATGRMVTPDFAQLWLAAAPWSPATKGAVTGDVVVMEPKSLADLDAYKGRLRGKVVLYGSMRPVPEPLKPLAHVWSEAELASISDAKGAGLEGPPPHIERGTGALRVAAMKMMADEGALAVLLPSRDGANGGGTSIVFDDESVDLFPFAQLKAQTLPVPSAVVTIEGYGRMYRLAKAGVPVSVEVNLDTEFTGDGQHGFNAIAEIAGTDPKLKEQVVMVGAHLDSWASGTGATDDGAGSLIALEAMRILQAVGVKPRRTIRVALWSGEEQGLWGSSMYIGQHLGTFEETGGKNPTFASLQFPRGAFHALPEYATMDAYFNLDGGSGRVRGLHIEGNLGVKDMFAQWLVPLKDLGATTVDPHSVRSTDHVGFDMAGLPSFQFIQDPLDYGSRTHHTNTDTMERLQEDGLKQAAVVVATLLYDVAQADEMLPRKAMK